MRGMKNRFAVGATAMALAVGVTAPAALAQHEDESVNVLNDAVDVEETLNGNEVLSGNDTLNDATVEAANGNDVEAANGNEVDAEVSADGNEAEVSADGNEAEAGDVVDVEDTLDEVLGL